MLLTFSAARLGKENMAFLDAPEKTTEKKSQHLQQLGLTIPINKRTLSEEASWLLKEPYVVNYQSAVKALKLKAPKRGSFG